jgi:hypothetical protein
VRSDKMENTNNWESAGEMIIKTVKSNDTMKMVKGLRFFKEEGGIAKYIVLYSKSKNGRKWKDDNRKDVTFGFFKTITESFKAKALIIGSHKFSLIVGR